MPLRGKTALVTGSSQGIGLAVAEAMAAAGARVGLTSERELDDLSDEARTVIEQPGATTLQFDVQHSVAQPGASYIGPVDLTRDGEAERLVARAWDELGGIDVLVNNVGTFREPPFLGLTKADFDAVFTLNVWSAIAVTQAVVRRAGGGGPGGGGGGRPARHAGAGGAGPTPQHPPPGVDDRGRRPGAGRDAADRLRAAVRPRGPAGGHRADPAPADRHRGRGRRVVRLPGVERGPVRHRRRHPGGRRPRRAADGPPPDHRG